MATREQDSKKYSNNNKIIAAICWSEDETAKGHTDEVSVGIWSNC